MNRFIELDVFRGWAIIFMIVFHLAYDLNYFHYIHLNLHENTFWVYFRYLIVTIFLLSVGISLALVHTPKIHWKKIYKRTFILGVSSLCVTIATYIIFPHSWVYFGILHFILFASWAGLPFLFSPVLSFFTAIFILFGSYFGWLHTHYLFAILQPILHLPPAYTEDLLHPFPWFAVILIGISMHYYRIDYMILQNPLFKATNRLNGLLQFLGKHALLVYLVHLPLLFGGVLTIHAFFGSVK